MAVILSTVHQISDELSERIGNIFWYWAMALQVADDVMDFPDDYSQNVHNLVALVMQKYPEDNVAAQATLKAGRHLGGRWLELNAPTTYNEIVELFEKYISQMIAVDPTNNTIQEMEMVTRSIFVLSTAPGIHRLVSTSVKLQHFLLWGLKGLR